MAHLDRIGYHSLDMTLKRRRDERRTVFDIFDMFDIFGGLGELSQWKYAS